MRLALVATLVLAACQTSAISGRSSEGTVGSVASSGLGTAGSTAGASSTAAGGSTSGTSSGSETSGGSASSGTSGLTGTGGASSSTGTSTGSPGPVFLPRVDYPEGDSTGPITARQRFDGGVDLAFVIFDRNELGVLLNNGDGTFVDDPDGRISLINPQAICSADFANVRIGDLVTDSVYYLDAGIHILIAEDAGGFGDTSIGGPTSYYSDLVAGDWNRDGNQDLAAVDGYQNLWVAFGNGNGSFQPFVIYDAGWAYDHLAVADFDDQDGLDLALASSGANQSNPGGDQITIFLNDGGGGLLPVAQPSVPGPVDLVAGDFDGVNGPDLAVVSGEVGSSAPRGRLYVLLNDGAGHLTVGALTYELGGIIQSGYTMTRLIAAADFDLDGKVDLAVAAYGQQAILLFGGKGDGTFQAPLSLPVGTFPLSVIAQDLNGDGKPDLAVGTWTGVSVFLNGR